MLNSVEDDNEELRTRIRNLEQENEELKLELQKWGSDPRVGQRRGLLRPTSNGCLDPDPSGLFRSCCDANPNEAPANIDACYYDVTTPRSGLGLGLFSCCQNVALTSQPRPSREASTSLKSALSKQERTGETSALIPLGQIGRTDSMLTSTASSTSAFLRQMKTAVRKTENVDFDGKLVCYRTPSKSPRGENNDGEKRKSTNGGIQFEPEADGSALSLTVVMNTLPSESGCFIGFAPASVDFNQSPFAPSKGFFLFVRHQTLYAQDGTIGSEFAKQQKFLLLACQKLTLRWDAMARVIRLYKDGQHLGECPFDGGANLPDNVGSFLPTILFANHDTTLTLPDD